MSLDPISSIVDDFNRADENPLSDSTHWKQLTGSGFNFAKVVSNQLVPVSGSLSVLYRDLDNVLDDQEVFVTVVTPPAAGGSIGVTCRCSGMTTGSYNLIRFLVTTAAGSNNDTWEIGVVRSGGFHALNSVSNRDLASGDIIMGRIVGTRVSFLVKPSGGSWTEVVTYDQPELSATSWGGSSGSSFQRMADGGAVGLWIAGTGWAADDFGGGKSGWYDAALPYPVSWNTMQNTILASSMIVGQPSNSLVDDLLLMVAITTAGGAGLDTPSGWTLLDSDDDADSTRAVFWRLAAVAGASGHTLARTGGSQGWMQACIINYRNEVTADPFDGTASAVDTSHDGNWTPPGTFNTTADGDLILVIGAGPVSSTAYAGTYTSPSGWNHRVRGTAYHGDTGIYVIEQRQDSAGATPEPVETTSINQSHDGTIFTIALQGITAGPAGIVVPQIIVYHDGR